MIYDAGKDIGTYGNTGEATSMMTVITNKKGDVVSAYPSKPKKQN